MNIYTENNNLIIHFMKNEPRTVQLASNNMIFIPVKNSKAIITVHDLLKLSSKNTYFTDILINTYETKDIFSPILMKDDINFLNKTEITSNDVTFTCYVSMNKTIRIYNEGVISSKPLLESVNVVNVSQNNNIELSVELNTRYFCPKSIDIYVRERKLKKEFLAKVVYSQSSIKNSNPQIYTSIFKISIPKNDLMALIDSCFDNGLNHFNNLDLYYRFKINEYTLSPYKFRLPIKKQGTITQEFYISNDKENDYLLKLVRTDYGNITFSYYKYPIELLNFSETHEINSINTKEKPIVLVCEYPHSARDNGLAFFNYLIKYGKDKFNTFYLIDSSSLDTKYLTPYPENIIYTETKEHVDIFIKSHFIIHSHSSRYSLPVSTNKMENLLEQKTRYFIQHGVISKRDVSNLYGYKNGSFTNFIISSSKRESDILIKNYNYPKESVLEFGLPRFDNLFKKRFNLLKFIKRHKSILLFFTWRPELNQLSEEEFMTSDYFLNIVTLLKNSFFTSKNLTTYLKLHINMEKYTHLIKKTLEDTSIIIIDNNGDRILQDYMIESDVMITDYSSAALDFALMRKPVIYYQLDNEKLDSDLIDFLPGFITKNENELFNNLKVQLKHKKITKEILTKITHIYFAQDKNASKRLYKHMLSQID